MDNLYLLAIAIVLCGTGIYAQAQHYKNQARKQSQDSCAPSPDLTELKKQVAELRGSLTQLQLKESFKR